MATWQEGDLLFTQIGADDHPIAAVVDGWHGARVNHVGVIVDDTDGPSVLEAYPPGVQLVDLDTHLCRSVHPDGPGRPRYLLARLRPDDQRLVPDAVRYGLAQLDRPYDHWFRRGDPALYCTELVLDMFRHANDGRALFATGCTSFTDPATGRIHPRWQRHFDALGVAVPEGELGSDPGDLSRDPRLEIVAVGGPPSGCRPPCPPPARSS